MATDTSIEPETGTVRKWWRRLWITLACIVAAYLFYLTLVISGVLEGPGNSRIKIAPETTYITEPLTSDGYADYVAALNARLGAGVTPDTNALVRLLDALGPTPENVDYSFHELMAEQLGIAPLPRNGDYLVLPDGFFVDWIADNETVDPADVRERTSELEDQRMKAIEKPWTTADYPAVAAHLQANEIPLAVVHEAVLRPHYYRPTVILVDDPGSSQMGQLIGALLPDVQMTRELARLLNARAMWHLGEGRTDEALADILATRRLARHIAKGFTLIESLVAFAIDAIAAQSEAQVLRHGTLTAEQARQYKQALIDLGPVLTPAQMALIVGEGERFLGLDVVQAMAAGKMNTEELGMDIGGSGASWPILQRLLQVGVNWNIVMITINGYYDELVAGLELPTRLQRQAALDAVWTKISSRAPAGDWTTGASLIFSGPNGRGKQVGDIFVALFLPAFGQYSTGHDRAQMKWQLAVVGFALAQYKAENERFPAALADLKPKYLADIPADIFAAAPLIYAATPDGQEMKVYSVGENGVDDGGLGYDDEVNPTITDDLLIRTPFYDPPAAEPESALESP